jgi:hypothetical protein
MKGGFARQRANSQASEDLLSRFEHPAHVTPAEAIARQGLTSLAGERSGRPHQDPTGADRFQRTLP